MEGRFSNKHEEKDSIRAPAGSPFSDSEETYIPSPKKSRRSARKNVVTVPITDGSDGLRSRGEVYPPPDSWSWRKYGQKPIKGSPYPRGYYRCSSSKGCPAKKQVERSRLDPTTLLITYSCDHNHFLTTTTTTTTKNHHAPRTSGASVASTSHSSSTTDTPPPNFPPEECAAFANQPDIEPDTNNFAEMVGEFGWLSDVGSTMMDGDTFVVGPSWADAEVEVFMPIGEEDKLLFGDLGDLPESAVVFRQSGVET